jgi:ABC-2 type transport system ATP-binding protein
MTSTLNEPELAIKTSHLTKQFGSRIAVNDLNIEIRKGEIFSLLGTNGAGKTTTIKMLCCLLKPSEGNAIVQNFNLNEDSLEIKKIIGVSPQETAVAGHLTSKENLLLMGGVYGFKKTETRQMATRLMELLEIEDRKDRASKLSGGMQRRLSIAMALMSDPDILFLDEPTLGLDPHARRSVWKYIEKLKKEKTILLTTHYLEEADFLADTIAIMNKGEIIEMGTSEELKNRYSQKKSLKITAENLTPEVIAMLNDNEHEAVANNGGVLIRSLNPDFYQLFNILQQNNVIIKGINMEEPTLDEVFLHLTEKEGK